MMNKDLLLKELDILKTYFEEVIDGASEDGSIHPTKYGDIKIKTERLA